MDDFGGLKYSFSSGESNSIPWNPATHGLLAVFPDNYAAARAADRYFWTARAIAGDGEVILLSGKESLDLRELPKLFPSNACLIW